jgi:hypothetical protein
MPKRGTSKAARRTRDRRRRSRGPKLALLGKRAFQGVAAAVGLAIGVTQLVDWLERRGDREPPLAARLEQFTMREDEALREFLRSTRVSAQTYAGEDRDQRGTGMSARLRARGPEPTSIDVRWTLIDAATGQPVQGARWSRIFASVYLVDPLDERVHCWVPPPPRRGRFFVLLTAQLPDGRVLASLRSTAFAAPGPLTQ